MIEQIHVYRQGCLVLGPLFTRIRAENFLLFQTEPQKQ